DLKFAEVRAPESVAQRSEVTGRLLLWFAAATLLLAVLVLAINLGQVARLRAGGPLAQISLELLLTIYKPLLWLRVGFLTAGVAWFVGAASVLVWRRKTAADLVMPIYVAC